jgi:hypothetical protein
VLHSEAKKYFRNDLRLWRRVGREAGQYSRLGLVGSEYIHKAENGRSKRTNRSWIQNSDGTDGSPSR